MAFVIIYMEMKLIALMNLRIGPDRVGPWGTPPVGGPRAQGAGQGGLHPDRRRPVVFTLAPVVVFLATVMALLVIPFAPGLFGAATSTSACSTSSRSAG